jgi:hypothetical protein|tara:strand:+ start:326 stop:658 length:333 start_codon:yes stop_codon:yes gene_type:complete
MAKQKFIYVQDGNNDALCWPVANFLGFVHAADTTLLMKFLPANNTQETTAGGLIDQITLTIASNSEKAVIESIIDAINDGYGPGMIVVADNVNQVYISSNVTDVACQTDS